MGVPVFIERPFPNQELKLWLEGEIAAHAGEVVMEGEAPVDGGDTVMVMAAFPDVATALVFAAKCDRLELKPEIVTTFRVRSEVLYGE